jgi:translocation and assembly module TamB
LVDSGFFDIGREVTPQLSDDVIVAGQPPAHARSLALDMDVVVGLGQQLVIRGRGLDAHLGGAVQFASKAGSSLTARGLMQVRRGTYKAYGRELAIERGILRFDGAPGNPALDLRAMRRGTEVEAGVSIGGTALAPRIALVSEPSVPDAEKLSWLVLGQGLATASGKDVGALQGAAAALLSQGAAAGVQSQLATAFGLDTIGLSQSQDNLQQRIITLGKRVSSRLYITYQQGLQTAGTAVLLRYTLSPRLTVEAETGTRSVFSLFYNMRFD